MLWVDHLATRYQLTMSNGISSYLDSGRNPIAGQWQHLTATYDGTHRPLLHRRHRGRQPPRHRLDRQLQHLADRRLRRQPRRLLRRPDRQRPHLQPRPHPQPRSQTDMNQPVGLVEPAVRRRTPGASTVTASTQTSISVQWSAVDRRRRRQRATALYRDGVTRSARPTATSFTFTGLVLRDDATQLGVEAFDAVEQRLRSRDCWAARRRSATRATGARRRVLVRRGLRARC